MRRLIGLVLLSACSSKQTVRVDLPIDDQHRAAVLAVEDGDELEVYAFSLEGERRPILQTLLPTYIGSYEVRLTAFLYDRALADIGLSEGIMVRATEEPMRPIPIASSTLTTSLFGENVGEWMAIARPNDRVAQFRIQSVPVEECIQRGGCFARGSESCLLPCPNEGDPMPPAPPVIPVPSCPAGWDDVEVSPGVVACTPWIAGPPACSGDETIFPGEAECHALGPGCPAGTFPTDAPLGPKIYVRAGATGDGSEASPLGSIQAAIDQANDGDVILIAAGRYREAVSIDRSVTLFGACPGSTTIDGPGVAVTAAAADTAVHNLTITADSEGVRLDTGASLTIADVIIEDTGREAINMVNAASASLDGVLIRNTGQAGIWMQGRAVLTGTRVHIHDNYGGSITADHASITLSDAVIRNGIPNDNGEFGRGANIQNDASLALSNSWLDGHHDIAIFVSTAQAELEHVVLHGTQSRPSDRGAGFGLLVQNGGVAVVRQAWIDENQDANVYDFGGDLTLEDSVLSRSQLSGNGGGGFNVQVIANGSAHLRRVAAVDAAFTNVNIGDGGDVTLEDLTVLGSGINRNQDAGDGIHIDGPTTPVLDRVRIEGIQAVALNVVGANTGAVLRDISIARAGTADCYFCTGLCLDSSSKIFEANRVRVEDTHGCGVVGNDQDTHLDATDLYISGTERSAACVKRDPARDVGRGIGLYVTDGAEVKVTRFLFTQNIEAGATLAEFLPLSTDTTLDLSYGAIRDNPIGVSMLIQGYDAKRLADHVLYDNDTNLNYGD